jgi:hypothetical protein
MLPLPRLSESSLVPSSLCLLCFLICMYVSTSLSLTQTPTHTLSMSLSLSWAHARAGAYERETEIDENKVKLKVSSVRTHRGMQVSARNIV